MAETAIEDLERAGHSCCSSHPERTPHWLLREGEGVRVAQVGPVNVIHQTLSREVYEGGQRGDFVTLRLEVRLPAN